ncbi:MAG: hypothetical protein VX794_01810 [Nitrospinota bacterium]|nr:hypothetical protein [Nitrospinota bacterium]
MSLTCPLKKNSSKKRLCVFFSIIFVILIFSDKGVISGDGGKRWEALRTIMEEGKLTSDPYSLGQPILSIPLYLLGDVWFRVTTDLKVGTLEFRKNRFERIEKIVRRYNKIVVFFLCVIFFLSLKTIFSFNELESTNSTFFLIFGSMIIPHAKDYYGELTWSFMSFVSIYCLSFLLSKVKEIPKKIFFLFFLSTAFAVWLNPLLSFVFTFLFIGIVLWDFFYQKKYESQSILIGFFLNMILVLGGIAIVLGLSVSFLENFLRRGNFLQYGYTAMVGLKSGELEGLFPGSFLKGMLGHLFSPARGIIFFAPSFFLGFYLIFRRTEITKQGIYFIVGALGYSILLMIGYSKSIEWFGGWSWGPRYLLPISVFSAVFFIVSIKHFSKFSIASRCFYLFLGFISFITYFIGVSINDRHLKFCFTNTPLQSNGHVSESCLWDFNGFLFSSIFRVDDWVLMFKHRSLPVTLVGILLIFLYTKFNRVRKF